MTEAETAPPLSPQCPGCGETLPRHKKDCTVAPLIHLAVAQGAQKALQGIGERVKAAAEVAYGQEALAAAGQIAVLRHGYTLVRLQDLRTIAGFACEHFAAGQPSCDEAAEERGGCCNACWAARWARRVLDERGADLQEPPAEPAEPA